MGKGKNNEELFRSMPVAQAILTLAVPTVVSQIITIIYNMADTFFIGQLGDPKQVAAATLAMPLFMFMTALSNLFGVGGASLISRFLGGGEREKASRCGAFCIWTAAAVSVLYGLMVLAGRPVLLPVLGANEETCDMASSYLFWTIGLGALPTVMNPALAHLIRSEGYSRQASLGVAFGGILNMVLDPLFIYGLHLQITGAAIATLISNATAMIYFLAFIWKMRGVSVLTLSPGMYTLGEHIPAEVISVGMPSFLISMMVRFPIWYSTILLPAIPMWLWPEWELQRNSICWRLPWGRVLPREHCRSLVITILLATKSACWTQSVLCLCSVLLWHWPLQCFCIHRLPL